MEKENMSQKYLCKHSQQLAFITLHGRIKAKKCSISAIYTQVFYRILHSYRMPKCSTHDCSQQLTKPTDYLKSNVLYTR